jgi:hypothetical protein
VPAAVTYERHIDGSRINQKGTRKPDTVGCCETEGTPVPSRSIPAELSDFAGTTAPRTTVFRQERRELRVESRAEMLDARDGRPCGDVVNQTGGQL